MLIHGRSLDGNWVGMYRAYTYLVPKNAVSLGCNTDFPKNEIGVLCHDFAFSVALNSSSASSAPRNFRTYTIEPVPFGSTRSPSDPGFTGSCACFVVLEIALAIAERAADAIGGLRDNGTNSTASNAHRMDHANVYIGNFDEGSARRLCGTQELAYWMSYCGALFYIESGLFSIKYLQ